MMKTSINFGKNPLVLALFIGFAVVSCSKDNTNLETPQAEVENLQIQTLNQNDQIDLLVRNLEKDYQNKFGTPIELFYEIIPEEEFMSDVAMDARFTAAEKESFSNQGVEAKNSAVDVLRFPRYFNEFKWETSADLQVIYDIKNLSLLELTNELEKTAFLNIENSSGTRWYHKRKSLATYLDFYTYWPVQKVWFRLVGTVVAHMNENYNGIDNNYRSPHFIAPNEHDYAYFTAFMLNNGLYQGTDWEEGEPVYVGFKNIPSGHQIKVFISMHYKEFWGRRRSIDIKYAKKAYPFGWNQFHANQIGRQGKFLYLSVD